ncbi:MAG: DUF1269 domain-containing protein [Chloroflexi bacterium]|nr:DUF1269 domain-containing protein [Chloroflexota bacterium]
MDQAIDVNPTKPTDEPMQSGGTEETPLPGPTGDPAIDASLELIIATFTDEASADAAFKALKEAERVEPILLVDAAVVNRDEGNNLHIKDELDWPGRVGAILGAGIGVILGMIGGPLGLVIGGAAGAAVGAAAAAGSDAGMSDQRLAEFASALKPGASMVIVAVARFWSEAAADILTRAGGEVHTIALTDELARQLHITQPDL